MSFLSLLLFWGHLVTKQVYFIMEKQVFKSGYLDDQNLDVFFEWKIKFEIKSNINT